MPRALASSHDPAGDLAHLARPSRARRSARGACSVCTESITQTSGRSAAIVASTASRSVSARTGTSSAPRRRGARRAGGPARPTPRRVTYSVRRAGAARWPSAIPVSVDLPMPGEPPSSTSEPGTRPPPSTRSSSPMPVDRRSSGAARLARGARPASGPRRPVPPCAAPSRGGARSSTSVFHAPQPGHWPCHRAD